MSVMRAVEKSSHTNNQNKHKLKEINHFALQLNTELTFDVYLKREKEILKLYNIGDVFDIRRQKALNLEENADIGLYIKKESENIFKQYLATYIDNILKNDDIQFDLKLLFLYESASATINALISDTTSGKLFENTKDLAKHTTSVILSNDLAIKTYMKIGSHNYDISNHSMDVAAFSIGFGNYLGFSYDEIYHLGEAAFLHDIGKSRIDHELLIKPDAFNENDFENMKKQPILGYEILQEHNIFQKDILKGVRHHHESNNGSGYPDKLSSREIHTFAKIIKIADVFSALTTQRVYKESKSTFEALKLMKYNISNELDMKLFNEFLLYKKELAKI